jgi:hypothetical protein
MKLEREDVALVRHDTTPRNIRFELRSGDGLEALTEEIYKPLDTRRKEKAIVHIDSIDHGTIQQSTPQRWGMGLGIA